MSFSGQTTVNFSSKPLFTEDVFLFCQDKRQQFFPFHQNFSFSTKSMFVQQSNKAESESVEDSNHCFHFLSKKQLITYDTSKF